MAHPPQPRRTHAIKRIHPTLHGLENIINRSDTKEVPRFGRIQVRMDPVKNFMHFCFGNQRATDAGAEKIMV